MIIVAIYSKSPKTDALTKDPMLNRFSFSYSPEQLGVRFKFGSLASSGLTAGETDATTTEVKAFLELFG